MSSVVSVCCQAIIRRAAEASVNRLPNATKIFPISDELLHGLP